MSLHYSIRPSRIAACLAACALSLGLAAPTHAVGWESGVTISDGTMTSRYPRVATRSGPTGGGTGTYVHAVWRDIGFTRLMYTRSINDGGSWSSIISLHLGPAGAVSSGPHIAAVGNTVHVVWEDNDTIMYLRNVANGGGSWDAAVALSGSPPESAGEQPDVAAYQDNVIVVWLSNTPPDVWYVVSSNNGATWSAPASLTSNGPADIEWGVRAAVWGSTFYVVWGDGSNNGVFTRKIGLGAWEANQVLWTGGTSHLSIAAYGSNVFVDRNDGANGPAQQKSGLNGQAGSWTNVWLGWGDDWPEIDTCGAYHTNGATAYFDTRGQERIYCSTKSRGESIVTAGEFDRLDIGAMSSGNLHVVAGTLGNEIEYYRYLAPRGFEWWWGVTGVSKSDAQWGDLDGDGDLDMVLSGDTSGSANVLVTRTYRNMSDLFGPLALNQDLSGDPDYAGVKNESSGNLAWGDYDNDGDLDLFVGGMTTSVRIARIYENNGLGTLAHDTAQSLTAVSQSAAAWGDYDADGDLDLVVTGHDGTQSRSVLYVNDLGTLTAHPTMSLIGMHAGSADWADWDGDGDLDLLLSGGSLIPPASSVRRVIFYENDGAGGLSSSGTKGLAGVSLSDAAFGDYDADGDPDLLCTGDGTVTTPVRLFKIYANNGSGVFSEVASPMTIYRSSGAWGDYDNDGDLDLGLCGYDGFSLHTRIYENTSPGFALASYSFPGVRDGSITWADVDEDGHLDFFMTGWDWGNQYADLYKNISGTPGTENTAPAAPSTFGNAVLPAAGGMQLTWSGATDAVTATAGLYYVLRVGTTSGGHEVVSGTYATPLMGNVGQATDIALHVPNDTYYWSVATVDSGLMVSDWSPEQTYQYCFSDINGNGQTDFADILAVIGNWGPCATPCFEDVNGNGTVDFADILVLIGLWGPCP